MAAENGADDSEKDANDTEEGAGKEASRHAAEDSCLACACANALSYIALCSGMFKFLNEYYDAMRGEGGGSEAAAPSASAALDERHSTADGTSVHSAR